MASADFSRFVVTACPCGLALETSPVMDVFFPSYTSLIYSESSEQLWDFVLFCRLIHSHKPWYQVSVRRVRCLPTASFRFHLAMDTLAFGYSLPTVRAAWGLAPVRIRSCWANKKSEDGPLGTSSLFHSLPPGQCPQDGLLSVMLIRYGQLLATFCTTGSQNSTAILGCHSLAETMLVHPSSVVGLECSFHYYKCFMLFISTLLGCKIR